MLDLNQRPKDYEYALTFSVMVSSAKILQEFQIHTCHFFGPPEPMPNHFSISRATNFQFAKRNIELLHFRSELRPINATIASRRRVWPLDATLTLTHETELHAATN